MFLGLSKKSWIKLIPMMILTLLVCIFCLTMIYRIGGVNYLLIVLFIFLGIFPVTFSLTMMILDINKRFWRWVGVVGLVMFTVFAQSFTYVITYLLGIPY